MFDAEALRATLAEHGPVIRVVIAGHQGSSPREDGAAMLVWENGQKGTIGGGALEYLAVTGARKMLAGAGNGGLTRHALGPGLGQCCGGVVDLVSEHWDQARLAGLSGTVVARPVSPEAGAMPFRIRRALARARNGRAWEGGPLCTGGWLAEPLSAAASPLWIWGAGHVGRALVAVLGPLPDFALTWIDTSRARFPDTLPEGVDALWAADPAQLVRHAPAGAGHLIVTFSHALDLELCHLLLGQETAGIGLIGSATKWARFRSRLLALGHPGGEISRITSPIGDMSLGKHPQAIAIGVAVQLLKRKRESGLASGSAAVERAGITDDSRFG
ncbi:xanthine dehydrogenase accessory protein XdhC [Pseudomonas sp. GX19020]|uniref:xanthine dehydrogenase accessory protein XdhC n=1 Tax=Pseudomonas sp. GX19020 TaxID=2942277 RepID=UPI0020190865|nr:xanthine dehydrogenase accessory protein XdhC [Pseudomonas sp. GX19020]MCL4069263.1 xanthine dehydrogenase accessory protein XdhC [Pseudomonas sp. GX19020]